MPIPANFEVQLTLSAEWVNRILAALSHQPYREVADILHEVTRQAEFQQKAYELQEANTSVPD